MTHGLRSTYTVGCCRCVACTHANRLYIREYSRRPERRAYNQQLSRDHYRRMTGKDSS